MTVKSFIGVSGFSYASWKGRFYPSDTKSEEFLRIYSESLGSVEINSSFYAQPTAAMIKSWAAKTGEEFRFSFKAPRLITHTLKLGTTSIDAASKLSDTIGKLGSRRGPILFQLPPFLKFDRDLLDAFLSNTPSINPKAFEFRHESWLNDSTYELLEDHGAGFCIADTEEMEPRFKVTGGLAYFRLRKDSYDANEIDEWSKKIRQSSSGSSECYVYLRHDETGENAVLAQRLSKKLQSM
jgi:uncharacterized protein YecE (DUF72 family)